MVAHACCIRTCTLKLPKQQSLPQVSHIHSAGTSENNLIYAGSSWPTSEVWRDLGSGYNGPHLVDMAWAVRLSKHEPIDAVLPPPLTQAHRICFIDTPVSTVLTSFPGLYPPRLLSQKRVPSYRGNRGGKEHLVYTVSTHMPQNSMATVHVYHKWKLY